MRCLLLALLLLCACGPKPVTWSRQPLPSPSPRPFMKDTAPPPADLAQAQRQFARDFLNVRPDTRQNAVWSPWGLYQVVAMAGLGARGTTAERIGKTLHAAPTDLSRPGEGQWTDECRVFHRPDVTIEPAYATLLQKHFGAGTAPFESVEPVNAWIAEVTRQRLPGALDPALLHPDHRAHPADGSPGAAAGGVALSSWRMSRSSARRPRISSRSRMSRTR